MDLFPPIDFPQSQGRPGMNGPPGPAGAAGAAGPAGPAGAAGQLSVTQVALSQTDLETLDTNPIILTPDVAGEIQLVVLWSFEINKTVGSGGPAPSFRIRYRGTTQDAVTSAASDLANVRNYGRFAPLSGFNVNAAAASLPLPITGLGLQVDWSVDGGALFRATALVTVVTANINALIP